MSSKMVIMLLGAMFVAPAFAAAGARAEEGNGWLAGRVCEADLLAGYYVAGAPLAGVNVSADRGSRYIITNMNGEYNLSLPEGYHELRFSKNGYHTETAVMISVAANFTTTQDMLLRGPCGNLSGKVIDEDGNPMIGARVASGNLAAFTEIDGTYVLANLPAGLNHIVVTANLVLDYFFNVTILNDQTVSMDFDLTMPSPLEVTVVDEDGGPIMGAIVRFNFTWVKTDGQGRAVLMGIKPGTSNTLDITAGGYKTYTKNLTLPKGGTSLKAVLICADRSGPREGPAPGFEALPALAVAALAALALRKRRGD